MAADGIPEISAKRCGEVIAQIRTERSWSRAKVIARLCSEIDPDDPAYDVVGEAWLARLENGRMVKVSRPIVEALCRALRCTPQERARVLLYADRNVLGSAESAPDVVAETLNYTMDRLYAGAHTILSGLIGQRQVAELDEQEVLALTATALELLIGRRPG